jgi:hypothetical protein
MIASHSKAAKLLRSTLDWRAKVGVGNLRIGEFDAELTSGKSKMQVACYCCVDTLDKRPVMPPSTSLLVNLSGKLYVYGNDKNGRSVLITRKKSDAFKAGEHDHYMRHLAFTLETSCRQMQRGAESWVW